MERAVLPALREFPYQRADHAPYGLVWYFLNLPLGRISKTPLDYIVLTGIITATLNSLVALSLPIWFTGIFAMVSLFNLVKAPWNCSILWLCLLGFIHPLLLIIPVIAKFPIGNLQVGWWQTRQALFWQKNPFYWGSLVVVWMAILIIRLASHLVPFA